MSSILINETEDQTESSRWPWCRFCCWEQRRPKQSRLSFLFFPLCDPLSEEGRCRLNEVNEQLKKTVDLNFGVYC